jgi:hypothetical protein
MRLKRLVNRFQKLMPQPRLLPLIPQGSLIKFESSNGAKDDFANHLFSRSLASISVFNVSHGTTDSGSALWAANLR